ncbi:MAG: RNA polymerase sigma factor [bacterium]|nr:RNA polymerase sigma factor [bacterium]
MNKTTYIQYLQKYRDRIYSLAMYNLRDADDAADTTQETFLRLWRYDGELNSEQAKAWLLRVCHNLCIDLSRRRKTVRTHFGVADQNAVDFLQNPGGENSDPLSKIQNTERQNHLLDSMKILPAETHSILMLHYFQDMKIKDIAKMLDLKASTIKVRLHRARKILKEHLSQNQMFSGNNQREIG